MKTEKRPSIRGVVGRPARSEMARSFGKLNAILASARLNLSESNQLHFSAFSRRMPTKTFEDQIVFVSGMECENLFLVIFWGTPVWLTLTSFRIFTRLATQLYLHRFFWLPSVKSTPFVTGADIDPNNITRYVYRLKKELSHFIHPNLVPELIHNDHNGHYCLMIPGEDIRLDFQTLSLFPDASLSTPIGKLVKVIQNTPPPVFLTADLEPVQTDLLP